MTSEDHAFARAMSGVHIVRHRLTPEDIYQLKSHEPVHGYDLVRRLKSMTRRKKGMIDVYTYSFAALFIREMLRCGSSVEEALHLLVSVVAATGVLWIDPVHEV